METLPTPRDLDLVAATAWGWGVEFLPRFFLAVLILALGGVVARWAARLVATVLGRTHHVDRTVVPVLSATARYGILILVGVAALGQIGVQTASLLAVLGAAGLAIGLALQGTLTNIAAGIMLLWLRPFRLGDYIEVQGGDKVSGIVKETGLFSCELETFDGIAVFAPNSTIWNFALKNHSRNPGRLLSFTVEVPAEADVDRARGILLRMLEGDRRVLAEPVPQVFVEKQTASALVLTCRAWAPQDEIGDIQRSIVEGTRSALESAGEGELRAKQIIRTVPPEADPSRLISFERERRVARA
jgi:small conductance mechanosensitive channel